MNARVGGAKPERLRVDERSVLLKKRAKPGGAWPVVWGLASGLSKLADLSADASLDLVGDETDIRVEVVALAAVSKRLAPAEGDDDVAELVDPAARPVDVRHGHRRRNQSRL